MADDAKIRLELELLGQEGIDRLKEQLEALNADAGELAAALGRGEISAAEFDAEMKRIAVSTKNLEQAVRALERAQREQAETAVSAAETTASAGRTVAGAATAAAAGQVAEGAAKTAQKLRDVDAAARTSTRGMRDWGGAALEVSRAVEDLQYGIAGGINQIPSLVMRLGGSWGLTAALSLAAVGAYQLYKHWGDLTSLFEEKQPFPKAAGDLAGLNEQLDSTKDKLKELEKLGSLTAPQVAQVEQLRENARDLEAQIENAREIEQLSKQKTAMEREVADTFKKALGESGQTYEDVASGRFVANRREMISKGYDTVRGLVESILKGDQQAYDLLVKGLDKD
jgi:hypothetical protein